MASDTKLEKGATGETVLKRRPRIAYLTANDPNDRRSWSGTDFSMANALQKHCGDIIAIGPLRPIQATLGKAIRRGLKLLGGPNYLYAQTISMSKKLGRMAAQRLAENSCDVIFAPAGSVPLAYLRTQVPIVYLSDATFRIMVDYYHEFSSVLPRHIRMADEIEQLAITHAAKLIYPSAWAARSAIDDYGASPDKVHIIPFGANFEEPPTREAALRVPQSDRCRLLFVGANWERKGGDIAIETLTALNRMGIPTDLTVVGCRPPEGIQHSQLHVIPFLNKNNPQEREQLNRIYLESHFFLLPTRAECFGIVLCEANAYGLPNISTATGGIPDFVRDGSNGFLLPLEARGDQYAALIRDIFADSPRYEALRKSSRDQFESRLNWDAWGRDAAQVIDSVVSAAYEPLAAGTRQ